MMKDLLIPPNWHSVKHRIIAMLAFAVLLPIISVLANWLSCEYREATQKNPSQLEYRQGYLTEVSYDLQKDCKV